MDKSIETIGRIGLIPVSIIPCLEAAVPFARLLWESGIPVIEVTYRSAAALGSMRAIKEAFPGMLVGAGTVMDRRQIDDAAAAGVDFIVTPGFRRELAAYCQQKGIAHIPGISTPSELEAAMEMGYRQVKFFPAKPLGGAETLEMIGSAYPQMRFITTGGVEMDNLREYSECPYVLAAGGDFFATFTELLARDWQTVREKCALAVRIAQGFEPACFLPGPGDDVAEQWWSDHFSCTAQSDNDTLNCKLARKYFPQLYPQGLFGHSAYEQIARFYLKQTGLTRCMVYAVNSVPRSVEYFTRRGMAVDPSSLITEGPVHGFALCAPVAGLRLAFVQKRVLGNL
ncbi:MAG TPA: bifunctional 4-hydroxy-2-oxoglutarate aldolase/2-dehydro-3-deoxy-phosphogluconate aldolase [Candidatus Fournierella excrementavium]|nr:bifunctional 4-hydroxy-2-oxoglutarate aldolase/2-dehydro-3-deoxy-phosphogluconate aldolase [Candidatus Fournierella excrementavium]